ncbi:MAG: acyltransferase family protein [Brevibacterium aurantiacum]|uniref:acyltransferase family protein n=1 Tax=Brevibacterium aurantiacum TaxID=273384 RepID=UPI003F901415
MPTIEKTEELVDEARTRANPRRFRKDIQGLRAIAVGSVVLYHLWPNRLPGGFVGVDIFLVISGFLITSHLLEKPPRNFSDVVSFWARRVKRLLPASLLVLAATGIATYVVAPQSIWTDTGRQIISAAFYVVNWDFAASSVNYLAADNAPSPIQHFWSLSVEEQFYMIWPIIIGLALLGGAAVRKTRHAIAIAVALTFAASLAFSLWFTADQPAAAYFVTPTRIWELVAGGLVAIFVTYRNSDRLPARNILAWVGMAGIVVSCLVVRPDMPFPGYVAMLPVASVALVILADGRGMRSPLPFLRLRSVQFLGNISYSVYLWHWPLIVLIPYVSGNLGRLDKAVIIAVTLILAWLSMVFVETRFKFSWFMSTRRRIFSTAGIAMVLVASIGGSQMWISHSLTESSEDSLQAAMSDSATCVGAEELDPELSGKPNCDPPKTLLLDPTAAKIDKSSAYPDKCWSNIPFDKRPTCTYGHGKTQVALIGNSHAGHWLPALESLAEENDWTITTFLVSRCTVSTSPQTFDTDAASQACEDYADWTVDQTTSGKFDAVITSERQSVPLVGKSWAETEKEAHHGYAQPLEAWQKAGLDVLVIRDTPYPGKTKLNIPDCVAANAESPEKCNGDPESWHWMDPLAEEASKFGSDQIEVVDPEKWICPGGTCRSVIGGVVTYFDGSHITATYSRTLSPLLAKAIQNTSLRSLQRP